MYSCAVKKGLRWVLVMVCCGFASMAHAEVDPASVALPDGTPGIGPNYGQRAIQFSSELALHLGHFQADPDGQAPSAFVGRFGIMQPLKRHEARVEFGFVQYGLTVPANQEVGQEAAVEQSTFRVSNPALTYYFPWRTLRRQIRLGLGVTAPLAHLRAERIERTRADAFAYEGASAMGGHRNLWLWMPRTFSAVGHFDIYHRTATGWIVGLELDGAGAMRISDEEKHSVTGLTSTPESVDLVAQAVMELAYDSTRVRTSFTGSYVTAPLKDLPSDQRDQIATGLVLRVRLGTADFTTSVLLPIDEPGGFGFDSDRHWSLAFGISTGTARMLPQQ